MYKEVIPQLQAYWFTDSPFWKGSLFAANQMLYLVPFTQELLTILGNELQYGINSL